MELCAETLLKEADDLAQEAEKKVKWDLVTKFSAFREKVKQKRSKLNKLERK